MALSRNPAVDTVSGIDHLYVTVSNLDRAQAYYDRAMRALGFKKRSRPLAGGDLHVHYFNRVLQFTLRPAHTGSTAHDPYAPGLHHVCFRVADRAAVDEIARALQAAGIHATPPREYPQYHDDYYATFFTDPDGIRLEIVNHLDMRKRIAAEWDKIAPIPDPDSSEDA